MISLFRRAPRPALLVPLALPMALLSCTTTDDNPGGPDGGGKNTTASSNTAGSGGSGGKGAAQSSSDGGPGGAAAAGDGGPGGSSSPADGGLDGSLSNTGSSTDGGADASGAGNGALRPGSGTLTIGNETWAIANVVCVFSAAAAGNPDFPFNLSGFGVSSTGARSQLSADIYDPSGQERLSGNGVTHHIEFDDVEDFVTPSVSWSALNGFLANGADAVITIDGKVIHGEGVFDDGTTDVDIETVPGTMDVLCP